MDNRILNGLLTFCFFWFDPIFAYQSNHTFLKYYFVGVPRLANYNFLNFQIEPQLGAGIDPGMAFIQFPSSILDMTRFGPSTFRSWVKFANH